MTILKFILSRVAFPIILIPRVIEYKWTRLIDIHSETHQYISEIDS